MDSLNKGLFYVDVWVCLQAHLLRECCVCCMQLHLVLWSKVETKEQQQVRLISSKYRLHCACLERSCILICKPYNKYNALESNGTCTVCQFIIKVYQVLPGKLVLCATTGLKSN